MGLTDKNSFIMGLVNILEVSFQELTIESNCLLTMNKFTRQGCLRSLGIWGSGKKETVQLLTIQGTSCGYIIIVQQCASHRRGDESEVTNDDTKDEWLEGDIGVVGEGT